MGLERAIEEAYCEASGLLEKVRSESLLKGKAEGRAEGKAEGRAEGKAEGQVEEARRLLRFGLHAKFSSLENLPEIDHVAGIEKLDALMEILFRATDAKTVQHAILAALKPN